MKILIVEDEINVFEVISLVIKKKFAEKQLDIISALTLLDGLKGSEGQDLIFLDLILPDSRVPEKTIMTFAPIMERIPTIIVTGWDESSIAITATLYGAKACLFKPSLTDQLTKAIDSIFKES